ncbi:hypothetical protein GCM10010313_19140 [Streptomyces violarus]|uniref:TIR domain-containing protein n=1 Tax=Streptomyces violarus TaxID=67380 RepID=A0A7W5F0N2_9ACTN|nr:MULTISPECIES: hypothetical protein [Streptomyces]MBB3075438.1 hypothetical protein [Streptomyces violarus]WRT98042.1 hypothetical protein VJ737_10275 [Streptomyces sp. CGMCC 4.1772]GHD03745.1 hypothetical protein GCM10010313_19140 [Streptomyces violarus]
MNDRDGLQGFLTFLGAGLNATASIIVGLAAGKSDNNRAFLVFSAVFLGILGISLFLVVLMNRRRRPAADPSADVPLAGNGNARPITYDVFLSSPMASLPSDEDYESHRLGILRVLEALERDCRFKVYYAGERRPTKASFERPDVGAHRDSAALRESARFLLVMPKDLVSSSYVEAGYALALGIPSVYYHQSDIRLPFMLRQAAQYSPDFPRCKEYEYQQIDDIVRDIEESGTSLFD